VVEANGSAGAEHVLDSGAGGDAAMPAVATLADGSFAIGWRSGGTVHVQQAAADGSLAGGQQVYGVLSSAFSPSIAALKQGGYMVSWGEINDGNVYAATSASGQAFVVNGDGYAASMATAAPLPHAATLANGNVVIAWDSYVNAPFGFAGSDVFFQVYDSTGHALGAPVQANLDGGSGHYDAAVTALSDGGFVLAWQSETGDYDGSGIFGRRFGADGSAIDPQEFEINQMRAGDQTGPDVVALANGGFAAAWVDSQAGNVSVEARVYSYAGVVTGPVQGGTQVSSAGSAVSDPAPVVTAPVSSGPGRDRAQHAGQHPEHPGRDGPEHAGGELAEHPRGDFAQRAGPGKPGRHGRQQPAGGKRRRRPAGWEGGRSIRWSSAASAAPMRCRTTAPTVSVYDYANGSTTSLANVERLQFSDQNVALDIHGNAGESLPPVPGRLQPHPGQGRPGLLDRCAGRRQ
jgi:hypothetical protein